MTSGLVDSGSIIRTPDLAMFERLAADAGRRLRPDYIPVALHLMPKETRSLLLRVYRYAQFVDEVGDNAPGDRVWQLDLVALDLRAARSGRARMSPIRALAPDLASGDLVLGPLFALIEANRQRQTCSSCATFDDLVALCQLATAPIGHVLLHAAHAVTQQNLVAVDRTGAALGVLARCQDVAEQARAGRVYLPATELRAAGLTVEDLQAEIADDALRDVIATAVRRAVELLSAGEALTARLAGWPRVAFGAYVCRGRARADALRRADYDVLGGRVKPARRRVVYRAVPLAVGRRPH